MFFLRFTETFRAGQTVVTGNVQKLDEIGNMQVFWSDSGNDEMFVCTIQFLNWSISTIIESFFPQAGACKKAEMDSDTTIWKSQRNPRCFEQKTSGNIDCACHWQVIREKPSGLWRMKEGRYLIFSAPYISCWLEVVNHRCVRLKKSNNNENVHTKISD